jgi:IS1 family transposase
LACYTYHAYEQGIDRDIISLTKEGMGIRSTARFLKISAGTLLSRIVLIAESITPPAVPSGKTYEVDEMRTFIKKKDKRVWLIYALDRHTKNIPCFNIGTRTNKNLNFVLKTLQNSQAKRIYTDSLKNYKSLIAKKIHKVTNSGTNHIERKNLTVRTHLKRLSRKTICFTKSFVILVCILKIYFWG